MSEINTINDQLVAAGFGGITVLAPKPRMTNEEALRLAAWLVAVVGDNERFQAILLAVQAT